mmetsp:Transcript_5453/g.7729  ORF Transcript_5453/g.7729 Transcript_5453/m.7729 type:complete len:83 (+) Transcript_5453:58-306(+)
MNENDNDSPYAIDTIYGMAPLQILAINPHAPALLPFSKRTWKLPLAWTIKGRCHLDYAREYNGSVLIEMIIITNTQQVITSK